MIKQLRKRFIRIATISVTIVLLTLCIIVNVANFISTNAELNQMLEMIYENQGSIPPVQHDKKPGIRPGGAFTLETPYSTRYFVLRYTDSGELSHADLDNIAAVTGDDTDKYLSIAIKHAEGFGYTSGYKFYVVHSGENRWMAIFLDCYQEIRSVYTTAILTAAAMAVCVAIVYVAVVLFSKKAVDPVVRSTQQQKQFITDASHELKTPITVIATSLKVLEMETGKQKWIDKAMAQTEKLKNLVNSLVTLSRMDEEESPMQFELFDISAAAEETADSFTDFAASNGHALNIGVQPGLTYCGDEYSVRQLVSILLDNAVKYASKDSPVGFYLTGEKKSIVIRTVNWCDELDKESIERLFDRFYRADKARTAGTGGFGIGLSIAKSIALAHKGSMRAQYTQDGNIEFTAVLK